MKQQTMAARVRALQDMTVRELRVRYAEVFGQPTTSRHKAFLRRKIAWRMQMLDEGDLSQRAKRRAAELANEADIRVRPPKDEGGGYVPAPERTRVESFGRVHDPRLPMPGTVLTREYRGKRLRVTVLDGGFEYEGRVFRSLSAVARDVTGGTWNGFLFFGLTTGQSAAGATR